MRHDKTRKRLKTITCVWSERVCRLKLSESLSLNVGSSFVAQAFSSKS